MTVRYFELCLCLSCGLRFPREHNDVLEIRCPHCLGEAKVISQKIIHKEDMAYKKTKKKNEDSYAVLLDNVRSALNVGSIFRSADGFGFEHVYVCGITPTPENTTVKKTSLGSEESVTWSYHKDAVETVKKLKSQGWKVYALEEDERAVVVQKAESWQQKAVLIVGNEVIGVDADLLSLCDEIFYIPMQGKKRSLNVAIAFSVAAFTLRNMA